MDNSSYMIQKNSMKYGGMQSDFTKKSEEAIEWGLKLVTTDKKDSDDYKDLFFTLLEGFAKIRHDLAISHKTKDAKYFGRSRMYSIGDVEMTVLGSEYNEFNKRLLNLFSTTLKDHIMPLEQCVFRLRIKCMLFRNTLPGLSKIMKRGPLIGCSIQLQ